MGYTHGEQWNYEKICESIRKVAIELGLERIPTYAEMRSYYGNDRLTNAISKAGGISKFQSAVNLPVKESETAFGNSCENLCAAQIEDIVGLKAVRMNAKYPYDILANGTVKIDVKSGHLYETPNKQRFYTFNLEKRDQTCDVFVCYCMSRTNIIQKTYIIPSCALSGKTQLSVGENKSAYDVYLDCWDIIQQYDSFMQSTIKKEQV